MQKPPNILRKNPPPISLFTFCSFQMKIFSFPEKNSIHKSMTAYKKEKQRKKGSKIERLK